MKQQALFPGAPAFQTKVIARRRDFDSLFEGFSRMRAVTYVASPYLVLEFMEKNGYTLAGRDAAGRTAWT